jgi:7-keto-8-aminopelargonate synthetase-like enzyme
MDSLDAFARRKLAALDAAGLRRALLPTARLDGVHVLRAGRQLISFSCNDYLGLAADPRKRRRGVSGREGKLKAERAKIKVEASASASAGATGGAGGISARRGVNSR